MNQEVKIALAAVQGDAKYDEQSKTIWRFKELIAPILQMTVEEFQGMPVKDVIACIDEPTIKNGKTVDDVSPYIDILDTEQISLTEKLIRYDTHLRVKNPKLSTEDMLIMLHIDLEIQNEYKPSNPSYPITKRAIYYAARELSSQLGILTEQTNYNKIEKVYSIWICNENIPKKLRNTITKFSITKENIKGTDVEAPEYYDLMDVVIVRRGGEPENKTIFGYINAVYSNNIEGIEEYTEIKNNPEIRRELGELMTASQSLIVKGIKQGMLQGEAKGEVKGRLKQAKQMYDNCIARNMSEEDANALSGYADLLEQYNNNN